MQPLLHRPPIANTPAAPAQWDRAHWDRPAVMGRQGSDWTWRQIHTAALELAAQLDPTSTLCNLCNTRVGFLVTWWAALRRGCVQLLPPSGGQTDLVALLKARVNPCIVVDEAQALKAHWADHARCLVHAPHLPSNLLSDADLTWAPLWDAPLVHLYTSGSTGTPEPQIKTLGQLVRGAQVLGARLDEALNGGMAALRLMVCSVPPQHMFGLETSVMLPWVYGMAVLDGRPLLPADVRATFERCTDRAVWIATPLHLRALAQSGEPLPHCAAVLASTMPLAPALAQQTETALNAPVVEIYGSTETGAVATRRTAHSTTWRPLRGVELKSTAQETLIWGTHFPSPQTLADQIEADEQGGFSLLGRRGDLIKIAGRRGSLANLNLVLQDLPGLTEGTFYLPASAAPTERLVLIYTSASLDRAATEAWLRERIDPVFLPRAFIRVERLPRTDSGKLARATLDELYAAWLEQKNARATQTPSVRTTRRFDWDFCVPADHPSLPGHFPGQPIVPGVVLLDTVFGALRSATGQRVARLQQVKFMAPLQPDEPARTECEIEDTHASFAITAQRDGNEVTLARGRLVLHLEPGA